MRTLRIMFMGTPEFAVGILEHLVAAKLNIVGAVTAPDKPAGRGKRLQSSAVKQYAISKDIEVLQPTNLKSDAFQADLQRLNPNLIIVVAFRMLPRVVWKYPEYGTFNLHASLLPQYRGAAPINWAIINGETTTGVTTFFIDENIDTGLIIDSRTQPISSEDNVESLHDKLMELGAELVLDTVKAIAYNQVEPKAQLQNDNLKPAPKLNKDNTKINWNKTPQQLVDFVRGLNPFPVAWAELDQDGKLKKVKLYKVVAEHQSHKENVGSTTYDKTSKSIVVAVNDGYIHIKELQFPGKKRMTTEALMNGMAWKNSYKFI
jgi:methionyl-tRNA formyltransferase